MEHSSAVLKPYVDEVVVCNSVESDVINQLLIRYSECFSCYKNKGAKME